MPDNAANRRQVLVDLADVTDTPDSEDFAGSRPHRWAAWCLANQTYRD